MIPSIHCVWTSTTSNIVIVELQVGMTYEILWVDKIGNAWRCEV